VTVLAVPPAVRNNAVVHGAQQWLDNLPSLVRELEREWSITVGEVYPDATEAVVARAELADGTPAVLKLVVPRDGRHHARREIVALRLARGEGCARLLRADEERDAMLVERLGRQLNDLTLPLVAQHEILCTAAQRLWRPAPESGLPTGAQQGEQLAELIRTAWRELDRPCAQRTVTHALSCVERRVAAHDDERAVLVHGDPHAWNALEAGGDEFKLVDLDGLLAEPEYDLGILMREDPLELMTGDPRDRAAWLAHRTGLDPVAIWEWGAAERLATGLTLLKLGVQPVAGQMLAAADRVATL
jgi:streptomycin 6-kinase